MSLDLLEAKHPAKRALITGGASGLGLATAQLLAARGWRLGLLDRDTQRLVAATAELRAKGSPLCEGYAVDTTDEAAVKAAIDDFAARCGGFDFAMNSAGVAVAGGMLETPAADWEWIMRINVLGVAHSCRAELPHMVASGGGLVINIASAASFACSDQMSAYNASKAAVVALSETLYQEFADRNVYVVAAMPGFFRTRLMEHARAPAEAAGFARKMMQASNLEADAVAREIVSRAAAGATHIVLPASYRWLWRFKRLSPRGYLRWMLSLRRRYARQARRAAKGGEATMYLLIKLLHIVAVVAFLGNITTGLFWHIHAARTRDPRLLAHTMDGIIQSDRLFTIPGVVAIIATGIAAAVIGGFPLLRTGWILWTLVLFAASGLVFMVLVAPLQRRLLALARAGTAAAFDYPGYHRLARRWEIWGAAALATPVVGLVLMVLKPAL